ncbi:uncharacterized protein IRX2-DT [Herpailurus yagouaroundi]|uniref:uncharacterized protein IRX2-DT n=1 Tax=Herpailurus yagouaroundi TaxID=1608482 RepID=UPI001AD742F1|nr:protein CEI [Puma yagouaroundi]
MDLEARSQCPAVTCQTTLLRNGACWIREPGFSRKSRALEKGKDCLPPKGFLGNAKGQSPSGRTPGVAGDTSEQVATFPPPTPGRQQPKRRLRKPIFERRGSPTSAPLNGHCQASTEKLPLRITRYHYVSRMDVADAVAIKPAVSCHTRSALVSFQLTVYTRPQQTAVCKGSLQLAVRGKHQHKDVFANVNGQGKRWGTVWKAGEPQVLSAKAWTSHCLPPHLLPVRPAGTERRPSARRPVWSTWGTHGPRPALRYEEAGPGDRARVPRLRPGAAGRREGGVAAPAARVLPGVACAALTSTFPGPLGLAVEGAPRGLGSGRLPRAVPRVPAGPGSRAPSSRTARRAQRPPLARREALLSLGEEGEGARPLAGAQAAAEPPVPLERVGVDTHVSRSRGVLRGRAQRKAWGRACARGSLGRSWRRRPGRLAASVGPGLSGGARGGRGAARARESCARAARGRCGPWLRPGPCSGGPGAVPGH